MTEQTTQTAATDAAKPARKPHGWREVLAALREPRVLVTLLLGFSSGLPFMLVGNTLGFWLREQGIELAAIGFLSWVGIAYSLKFLWAPIIDRVDLPLLGRLGRRRGWMVLTQIVVGIGLFGMAAVGPGGHLWTFALLAVITAFAAASQDTVVDAWRIERAESPDDLGLLTAAFQFGYRVAILATDAWLLVAAAKIGWPTSYLLCAAAMGVGLTATLFAAEPARTPAAASGVAAAPLWTPRGFFDAVVGPFVTFFQTHGPMALLMLCTVALYRLPDFLMGPMAAPLYTDLGLAKEMIGAVRTSFGLVATFVGIALAGLSAVKLGFEKTLVLGAVLGPGSNLAFSAMALAGPDMNVFIGAMIVDNISTGFAGAALVAYMSSLTSLGYTATQYALLSSTYAMLGKFLKGFSGAVVEGLEKSFPLMTSYAIFFAGTAAVGIPVVILSIVLSHHQGKAKAAQASA